MPFFEADGDSFRSTTRATSPWDAQTIGGGPLAALLAHGVEAQRGGESFRPVRLTVDLLRPAPAGRLGLQVQARREGKRLRVVEGSIATGETVCCQASAVFCRAANSTPDRLPAATETGLPRPDELEILPRSGPPSYATSMELRPIRYPSSNDLGIVWVRFPHQLAPGIELSPFARAALASDAASGFAFITDEGVVAINCDLTLYLHREPCGDWICIEVVRRQMHDGIAVASASLHDIRGLVGDCIVGALAVDRPIRPASQVKLPTR